MKPSAITSELIEECIKHDLAEYNEVTSEQEVAQQLEQLESLGCDIQHINHCSICPKFSSKTCPLNHCSC